VWWWMQGMWAAAIWKVCGSAFFIVGGVDVESDLAAGVDGGLRRRGPTARRRGTG